MTNLKYIIVVFASVVNMGPKYLWDVCKWDKTEAYYVLCKTKAQEV